MKKIVTIIMCYLLFKACIFATDIRQVMFGNNYETIQEISSRDFLKKYPEAKSFDTEKFKTRDWKETDYRVFKQELCGKTFYRLVAGREKLTDEYILNWRNPDDYINHYRIQLYLEDGGDLIAILNSCVIDFDFSLWENGTTKEYNSVEIIHRNNKINGFLFNRLVDIIDHHNRTDESGEQTEEYINSAKYYLFDDVINAATEKTEKIKYVKNYQNLKYVSIEVSQPLVDSKRPFMYTINNAFDGNPGTAYVENTEDNGFIINLNESPSSKKNQIKKLQIINGYALNENIYLANNRIGRVVIHVFEENEGFNFEKKLYLWNGGEDEYFKKLKQSNGSFYGYGVCKLKDNTLEKQEIDLTSCVNACFYLEFGKEKKFYKNENMPAIYEGLKFTDTCVSELDFYIDNKGWMFGD